MTLINSENVLLEDIYVNSTSNDSAAAPTMNTDGADTIYASNITFNRWHVINGDDWYGCTTFPDLFAYGIDRNFFSISPKANSSDIYVLNSICESGSGLAMGSIGQFKGVYEFIENFYAENITFIDTRYVICLPRERMRSNFG